MTPCVIVVGCSWLMGEWQATAPRSISVVHPGVSEFMPEWCELKNLSRNSASNWSILEIVMNYMNQYRHMVPDATVVVFQTDPMRHTRSQAHDVDYQHIVSSASSIQTLYQTLCEIWYIKLNELAARFDCKISVSGALSDVDVDVIQMYKNIECVCPSWIKMLHPDHTPSSVPLMISSDTFELLHNFGRIDLVDELMSIADKNVVTFQDLSETVFFGPGLGHFHPSRQGHKVLSNHLKKVFSRAVE